MLIVWSLIFFKTIIIHMYDFNNQYDIYRMQKQQVIHLE